MKLLTIDFSVGAQTKSDGKGGSLLVILVDVGFGFEMFFSCNMAYEVLL